MKKIEKELKRLEQMPPLSSEASVSSNYIDLDYIFTMEKLSERYH